jgi:hypothetical protein
MFEYVCGFFRCLEGIACWNGFGFARLMPRDWTYLKVSNAEGLESLPLMPQLQTTHFPSIQELSIFHHASNMIK